MTTRLEKVKTEKDLQKFLKKHSDITVRQAPPTLADEVAKLIKEAAKLKKEIASIRLQSQKAYDKAFRAEMIWLTLILNQQPKDG